MADRRQSMDRGVVSRRSVLPARRAAWVLAVAAGTPLASAQFDLGGGNKAPDPQSIAQAGGGTMRDPIGGKSPGDTGGVRVSDQLIVELHVKDEDLANVLQMLSIQSQINIIASKNVSATVTADLYGATFFEALDAILHVNGYGYVQKANFIYIYTAEELQAIQDANRKVIHKTIRLDYLNGTDAAEFATPLLSDKGVITTNGASKDFTLSDNAPVGKDDYALGAVMVVTDYEENVEAIETLVHEIDTRPAQVLVEATVLQTQLTEANSFGIDFTVLGSLDMADFVGIGGPLKAIDGLLTGAGQTIDGTNVLVPDDGEGGAITQNVGQTQGPGGLKVGVVAGDVAAFLKVLDEVTDTTVISRPNILTLNRQPARVLVGTKVGYLSSTSTDTSTTQTVQFLDTGTQLYFRPFVSRDGMVRMELKPQVSNAVIRDVTDSGGATVTIPDENTSELSTNVIVRDGNTIVLGGLFTENTTAGRRQVPFLGDLPIVGQAFRGNDDRTDRSEIIFMIKPTIVNDQLMIEQGQRGSDYVNHARAGARAGLLIWSRERQSARLLVEADRKERAGDSEGALYCVERSLSINPYQPEAIAMRERLSTKKKIYPTRSMLDIILKNETSLNPARGPVNYGTGVEPARFGLGNPPADAWDNDPHLPAGQEPVAPTIVPNEAETNVASGPQARVENSRSEQELAVARAELARVNQQLDSQRTRLAAAERQTAVAQARRDQIANAPLENESVANRGSTGDSPWVSADESAYFDGGAFARTDAPIVDGSVGPFSSDEVDTLIDEIAADAFWRRPQSEKYLKGLSSGERGAPFAG